MAKDTPKLPDDIKALNFENALKELESIVEKLESGGAQLEESIKLFERGEQLKVHCGALLSEAQNRIEKITLSADGAPEGTQPLDVE